MPYMWPISYKIDNFCVNKPKSMTRSEVWYSKQVTLVTLVYWSRLSKKFLPSCLSVLPPSLSKFIAETIKLGVDTKFFRSKKSWKRILLHRASNTAERRYVLGNDYFSDYSDYFWFVKDMNVKQWKINFVLLYIWRIFCHMSLSKFLSSVQWPICNPNQ